MARKVTVIPAKKKCQYSSVRSSKNGILRVAAYCRVSTEHEEQINSFENQVAYYTDYINGREDYELAGIYADEGITATNTKKRDGFKQMIADCDAGKIDMVITKSISRFARNTKDCLEYSRHLKNLGINVYFEKENINTMDASGELLFTILSSLAQEESRNISDNCKWAIRHNFQKGKPTINTTLFTGYDKDENGNLVINEKQAEVIRYIFKLFEEGLGASQIRTILIDKGIKGLKTNTWPASVIESMLQNEKYCGDLIMQKTYTVDFLSKRKAVNQGEVDQYFVENNHPAIIPKEEWIAVQMELQRRKEYMSEVGIKQYGYGDYPFSSKVVCSHCGKTYGRVKYSYNDVVVWQCYSRINKEDCKGEIVKERTLYKAFNLAWNSLIADGNRYIKAWELRLEEGDPLERLRARQMIELVEQGPVDDDIPELVQMTLERIVVLDKDRFEVRFLDGTKKVVCIKE